MEAYSPPTSRRSAGTMTPSLILTMSPGTSVAVATSCHLPSRTAVASGASPFPQRGQRVGCLAVLPEFERGIEEQQRCDDGEVVPMPDDGRNDRGGLDHVGVRAGEVPHDLAKQADLFFNEGVGSAFGEPFARLGAAQSLLGLDGELGKDLLDRHPLEVNRGLRSTLGRSRSGLQGNGGHGLLLGTRSRESGKGVFQDNATRPMDRDQRPARGAGYWARRGNDDYEFGLSFGSLMARLRASDIGSWMLM